MVEIVILRERKHGDSKIRMVGFKKKTFKLTRVPWIDVLQEKKGAFKGCVNPEGHPVLLEAQQQAIPMQRKKEEEGGAGTNVAI